jgi:isopentenyl diphosphate isomerase/L-lactate dehydrogenase-like FMN-dependent dehydrogenase
VRRGTDVMKCLALGADAIFLNRPVAWGLCYNVETGLKDLLCMFNEEVRLAMALTHCFKIKDITHD